MDEDAPTRLRATPSWLITHIATYAGRLLTDAFETSEWRRYHYALLTALAEFGPSSQAALGRRCQIDRSYIVEAVNELADGGLVSRAPDPADRRRNIITITEAGTRKLHVFAKTLDGVQDTLLAPLAPAERGQLVELLDRVLTHHWRDR